MMTNEQVRHYLLCHLHDVARWQAVATDGGPVAWAEFCAIDNIRDLRAWGHVGPRGVG